MEGRATVCVSVEAQAGTAAKEAAAPAVWTEGAALGGSAHPEGPVLPTEGELKELARMAAECNARASVRARARERAIYECENAWRDAEIVVSNVVHFYSRRDSRKAVP